MFHYLIRRILLMFPTLFAICLVVFLILNIAPGKPGQDKIGQEGAMQASQGKKRESYKIFKEQFNLDKPIMFNARFMLTDKDIEKDILTIANLNGKESAKNMTKAHDKLDDLGEYAVPHLVTLLNQNTNPKVQKIIVGKLVLSARKKLIKPYDNPSDLTSEEKAENKQIAARNRFVAKLRFPTNATSTERTHVIQDWNNWYLKNKNDFHYSFVQKIGIFFLDTRFAKYFNNLLHLNFGISHIDKKPVLKTILERLRYSITISLLAVFFTYLISVPIGVYSAIRQYSKGDRILTVILFVLYSLPSFFVGTILLTLLSQGGLIPVFPTGGFISSDANMLTTLGQLKNVAWHLILPVACLTYGSLAMLSRYARTGLLEVIRSDYIRTARAKGLPEKVVIIRHAVRNGMIPILTLLASILPILISGSIIIEFIFNIPGIGTYVLDAIHNRDYNAIMAVQLITAVLTLFGILVSDISYVLVDPRIKFD